MLSDLDGTLIPIRRRAGLAVADRKTRAVMKRLRCTPGVRLSIVSGRSLRDVRRAAGVPGLIYVGNHGLELGVAGGTVVVPAARRSARTMTVLARELAAAVQPVRGAFVEDKRYSLSVHWRGVAPRDVRRFHRLIDAVLRPWRARRAIRVTAGKRVVEVRPPTAWDKGSAVEWLIRRYRYGAGEVAYLGDDRTDEDAFLAVNRRRGMSVCVGPRARRSIAGWRLDGPAQALEMLKRIAEERCRSRRKR